MLQGYHSIITSLLYLGFFSFFFFFLNSKYKTFPEHTITFWTSQLPSLCVHVWVLALNL